MKEFLKVKFDGSDEEYFGMQFYHDDETKSLYWSALLPCEVYATPLSLVDAHRIINKLQEYIDIVKKENGIKTLDSK